VAGKAKGVPRDTTVTLRLPRELHDQLKEAARGRSVSEEMRVRLARSLTNSPQTAGLLDAVAEIARRLPGFLGSRWGHWHEDPYAFIVFKSAVETLLLHFRPKSEEPLPPPPEGYSLIPDLTLEQSGIAFARGAIMAGGL
jgi:hypothetical protein